MASSRRPTRRTMSRSKQETEDCTHVFEISQYSLLEGFKTGLSIQSADFTVGGHDWCILFYPSGSGSEEKEGYVSIFLKLMSEATDVSASFDFRLLDPTTGVSSSVHYGGHVFCTAHSVWGFRQFKKMSELKHPSSTLSLHLGNLLESGEGADVKFKVKGEVISAHKVVVAAQSPVFKAQLYGPMSNKKKTIIAIEDMEPSVFKSLLHFIYKDSLPSVEDLDDGDEIEVVKHLLEAADRYGVERMKVICESILGKRVDIEGVADTLVLADQLHCSQLKDACIQFINSSNRTGC
ncbi:hypothetical protein HU200_056294 [Digitaria exilis]|uniref:Uncharacterized protein n=1 Tax=Digitaria exilis TaxID=1010633 RepID=A0A835AN10_9POAL|nr:hypothetical protein HU200_056294 [Digitaria exilis]